MNILIAEDDPVSHRLLQAKLTQWGYEVTGTDNGEDAWKYIQDNVSQLAILDWMMPGMDGIDICREVRKSSDFQGMYIILLTTRCEQKDIILGLKTGADDYIIKPFESEELLVRVQVGERVLNLQTELAERVRNLEEAMSEIKQLEGILPVCSYCKKIRNDQDYWQQFENYITEHSKARFSHGICPECWEKYARPQLEEGGQ